MAAVTLMMTRTRSLRRGDDASLPRAGERHRRLEEVSNRENVYQSG